MGGTVSELWLPTKFNQLKCTMQYNIQYTGHNLTRLLKLMTEKGCPL